MYFISSSRTRVLKGATTTTTKKKILYIYITNSKNSRIGFTFLFSLPIQ